jgi:hypothetical protein
MGFLCAKAPTCAVLCHGGTAQDFNLLLGGGGLHDHTNAQKQRSDVTG